MSSEENGVFLPPSMVESGNGDDPNEIPAPDVQTQFFKARNLLAHVYDTSMPLWRLGYTADQGRVLHELHSSIIQGNAVKEGGFFRFDNPYGQTYLFILGNDYRLIGRPKIDIAKQVHLQYYESHPNLALLHKPEPSVDIQLSDLSTRLFRGSFPSNPVRHVLTKVPGVKNLWNIKNSFEAQWLDEQTKQDVVICFLADDTYHVYRKLFTDERYEIWGERKNLHASQIKEALAKRLAGKVSIQLASRVTS
jgi:hypothetical protein